MELEKHGRILYSAGKIFPSQYDNQLQQNIVVEFSDGQTERVYFPAHDPIYTGFKKGQAVKVVWNRTQNGHMRKTVFALENNNQGNNNRPNYGQQLPRAPKRNTNPIANLEFVKLRLDEFSYVFNLVQQKFPNFTDENKRALATSILIEGRKENRDFSTFVRTPKVEQPAELTPPPLPNFQQIQNNPPQPQVTQAAPDQYAAMPSLPVPVKPANPLPAPTLAQNTPPTQPSSDVLDNIPF